MPSPPKAPARKKDLKVSKEAALSKPIAEVPVSPVPPKTKNGGPDDFALPTKEVYKPDNQLQLVEKDLQEEIAKMLTANNPAAPKNTARFNMKERVYKLEPMVEQLLVHYATDGWLMHKASEDARKQQEVEKQVEEAAAKFQNEVDKAKKEKREEGTDAAEGPDDSRQLRNQFNFSERAAQTLNYPMRDRETTTEPPPTASFSGTCSQWEIYDAYIADQEKQRAQEEVNKQKAAAKKATTATETAETSQDPAKDDHGDVLHHGNMERAVKVLERMENQNTFKELAMDFKYWDDMSDQYRQAEGSLLPLWKFYTDHCKHKHVTSLCWNPEYYDLFAVGYGSFDFLHQSSGLVCCYSLKNPSYPEYVFSTDSGVMCLDFHPQHPNLLALGCYDGSVSVYDVRRPTKPLYSSTAATGKHTDPVWEIFWQEDEMLKQLQFFSVASDGRVTLWTLAKSELLHQEMMELRLGSSGKKDAEDEPTKGNLAGGCCFDFNKAQDHLFVVGTEEGHIHKCSQAYNSEYLQTYQGHDMTVYAVKWNNIHTRIFLSASADWTLKLWEGDNPRPVMSFDLNNPVGDAAWSPHSATVFAAVTDDGKVHVYDLAENKHDALCQQKVVKKAKLTKISFNPKHPILIVGDDRGCVTCLKLSPNLRKVSKPAEDKQKVEDLEIAKLNKVIEIAMKGEMADPAQ
ncbi:TPA: Dynein, 78 kDa intermediate chain, flagellar outer arm [Trebouxia sp. C0004]